MRIKITNIMFKKKKTLKECPEVQPLETNGTDLKLNQGRGNSAFPFLFLHLLLLLWLPLPLYLLCLVLFLLLHHPLSAPLSPSLLSLLKQYFYVPQADMELTIHLLLPPTC